MTRRTVKVLTGAAVLVLAARETFAAYSFTFGPNDENRYLVASGQRLQVPLYLVETGTSNLDSATNPDKGLFGVGFRLEVSGSSATFVSFVPDPSFEDGADAQTDMSKLSVSNWAYPDAGAIAHGAGFFRQLGTLSFDAGPQTETTTFTVISDNAYALDETVLASADNPISSPLQVVVPEPVVMSTMLVVGMQLGFRRRREDNVPRRK